MEISHIVSGALVGLVVGATGVGGGSLMTPLLTLFFGIPAQVAVGTDLLFASLTKSAGAWSYSREGVIPWRVVRLLATGSIPASLATVLALQAWHPDAARFSALVRPVLGFALLLTAGAVLLRGTTPVRWAFAPVRAAFAGPAGAPTAQWSEPARERATIATGLVLGVLVTLTSVGAGAIGMIALLALYPGVAARRLVAADIAHAVPLTLVAGLGHVTLGSVDWNILGALLLGSVPAIHVGARLSRHLPERGLRLLLALILALVGARTFSH